jgi:hypothetical protein
LWGRKISDIAKADRDRPFALARIGQTVLVDRESGLAGALIAGILVTIAACLLAVPSRIVSREMTWDLLFNLEGAWHLHNGHVPHVDFHDPLGSLHFALTAIGFKLVGLSPHAFIVGELLAVAALFAAALVAVRRRLPLLPAVLFVVFVCQLVLMPINIGDSIRTFTFAMTYNSIGWSALTVLCLILFLPPRGPATSGWLDTATSVLLLLALFHLKITYFAAALGTVVAAVVIAPHIRRHALRWIVAAGLLTAYALAPWNEAYLADIFATVDTGAANADPVGFVILLFTNVIELCLLAIGVLLAFWLWRSGAAKVSLPLAAALLMLLACAVLRQNTQERGLVLSLVVVMLLYDHFRGDPRLGRLPVSKWMLLALLVLPAAKVLTQTASLAGYSVEAAHGTTLFTFEKGTALEGLAVPMGTTALMDAASSDPHGYRMFTAGRAIGVGQAEVSQYEYAQSLLDAARLFDDPARREGAMAVLDQVNPLPFMLGRLPPRGSSLWLDQRFPWRPGEEMLGDAAYVLVPKFPTYGAVARAALERYAPYIAANFPVKAENRSWWIYSRR